MPTILIEPSCYVFADPPSDDRDVHKFAERFWPTFSAVKDLVELNQLEVPLTADLYSAVEGMFPYDQVPQRVASPGLRMVLAFLERHTRRPLHEFQAVRDFVEGSEFCRSGPVYANDDVWLAWTDLLSQLIGAALSAGRMEDELIASWPEASCVPASATILMIPGVSFTIRPFRVGLGIWPGHLLDPDAYRALKRSGATSAPAVCWEDSGHTAPRSIQKVLSRTAADMRDIVTRVGTTYRADSVAETCKVSAGTAIADVGFRISDGHVTFKGVFTTLAVTSQQQRIATQLVARQFRERCTEEGLRIAEK